MASENEIMHAIMNGINFGGAKKEGNGNSDKVRTKAKRKGYITGSHGSGAAKMKADIRKKRANRHKGK